MSEDNALFLTGDGSHSISSGKFGVSYHSRHGAIQETQHVFIDAGLRFKAVQSDSISILEIGFGTGLNALMTYLEAAKRNLSIHYHTIEAYPIDPDFLDQFNYIELLAGEHPVSLDAPIASFAFRQMHALAWNEMHVLDPPFYFHKMLGLFEEVSFPSGIELVYFDAFAPNAQAEFWEVPFLQKVYDCMAPEGALVTYCAKGSFKRNLKAVGFTVERLPGPPGKREMTRALKL
ncbi:MAG: tRNA (5-methylaminomethyl-2-thiouridine)(34)-methyltransferase MnmD [Bacteroidota bacterium]